MDLCNKGSLSNVPEYGHLGLVPVLKGPGDVEHEAKVGEMVALAVGDSCRGKCDLQNNNDYRVKREGCLGERDLQNNNDYRVKREGCTRSGLSW